MVKKSEGKRVTVSQKHKMQRKVKEHHRKKRKEANKEAKAGQRKKVDKDPGMPFKEQELKALEVRCEQELESKKEARKERDGQKQSEPVQESHEESMSDANDREGSKASSASTQHGKMCSHSTSGYFGDNSHELLTDARYPDNCTGNGESSYNWIGRRSEHGRILEQLRRDVKTIGLIRKLVQDELLQRIDSHQQEIKEKIRTVKEFFYQ